MQYKLSLWEVVKTIYEQKCKTFIVAVVVTVLFYKVLHTLQLNRDTERPVVYNACTHDHDALPILLKIIYEVKNIFRLFLLTF